MDDFTKGMKDFIKLIDENEFRYQLISASLFVSAYDILISTIINEIKDFYNRGFDENGPVLDPRYKTEVKGLYKKDIIKASLLWLKDNEIVDEQDLENVKKFRAHRNEIAHEMSSMIADSSASTNIGYFSEMRKLRFKILKWWFINFEMEINQELSSLNPEELDFEEVLSMKMFVFDHLCRAVDYETSEINERREKSAK